MPMWIGAALLLPIPPHSLNPTTLERKVVDPAHAEPPSFDAEFALYHVCFAVRLGAYGESPIPRGYASNTYFSLPLSKIQYP